MSTATITIGPEHHGQTISFEDYLDAEFRDDFFCELSRGVITVIDIPNRPHQRYLNAAKDQFYEYKVANPGVIDSISTGAESRILVAGTESDRHPDLAIYKTAPPEIDTRELWKVWIPELVIEVVSPESADRDYNQKPEDYLQFGVKEYWIIDGEKQCMTVRQRVSGKWATRVVTRDDEKQTTHQLPGFEFDLKRVLDAAKQ